MTKHVIDLTGSASRIENRPLPKNDQRLSRAVDTVQAFSRRAVN